MRIFTLLVLFFLASETYADALEFGADYFGSPDGLVIKGRNIPVQFGSIFLGVKHELTSESVIGLRYGRGFDNNVSTTFLGVKSNGPATSSFVAADLERRIKSTGKLDIGVGTGYKFQESQVKLNGNAYGGTFSGAAEISSESIEFYSWAEYRITNATLVYAKAGGQSWEYDFQAFGAKDSVRVWTDSVETGISPKFSLGGARRFGGVVIVAEVTASSLSSDNDIWVRGLNVRMSWSW